MMPLCAAYKCTARFQKKQQNPLRTFHRFPKDAEMQQKWLKVIRRKNFTPSASSRLCSDHFREEDIDRTSLCRVRIREGAVPLMKQEETEKKKDPMRIDVAKGSTANDPTPLVDNHTADFPVPRELIVSPQNNVKACLKRKLTDIQAELRSARKTIKGLQQSNRRLIKRNASLESDISAFKRKALLCEGSSKLIESCANDLSKPGFTEATFSAIKDEAGVSRTETDGSSDLDDFEPKVYIDVAENPGDLIKRKHSMGDCAAFPHVSDGRKYFKIEDDIDEKIDISKEWMFVEAKEEEDTLKDSEIKNVVLDDIKQEPDDDIVWIKEKM